MTADIGSMENLCDELVDSVTSGIVSTGNKRYCDNNKYIQY